MMVENFIWIQRNWCIDMVRCVLIRKLSDEEKIEICGILKILAESESNSISSKERLQYLADKLRFG